MQQRDGGQRDGGQPSPYGDDHRQRYEQRRPEYQLPLPPRKSAKSKAVIATSAALAVFAAGAIAVVASGALKNNDAKSPSAAGTTQAAVPATAGAQPPATSGTAAALFSDQVPTISDGTDIVRIDHRAVKFPSTVTDAVWSPNGTRLAYIDGDGDLATADPDGTDVHVLTKKTPGVKRAHPAWQSSTSFMYVIRKGTGPWLSVHLGGPYDTGEAGALDESLKGSLNQKAPDNLSPSVSNGIEAFQAGGDVLEPAYLPQHIDPDVSGLGGYPWSTVAKGSDPAVNADGLVAYVGTNGQIWTAAASFGWTVKPTQITFGADHPSRPAWSPDGKRVAFSTKTDVESVSAIVQPGASSNPTHQEDPKPGVPAYQSVNAIAVDTFDGSDPTAVSLIMAQAQWTDYHTAATAGWASPSGAVVIASSSPTDIDAAAAYAAQTSKAFYITPSGQLDPRITADLTRLFDRHDKRKSPVLFLGDGSIPASADADVASATGHAPLRVTPKDAYDTATAAETAVTGFDVEQSGVGGSATGPRASEINLVVADDDRPALLAAIGALRQAPGRGVGIVLTKGATMPGSSREILDTVTTQTVIAIGDHAGAALAASWPGKPSFKVTQLSASIPMGNVTAKNVASVANTQNPTIAPAIVVVIPAPTADNWTTELLLVAAVAEPVLFGDAASGLDSASLAYLKTAYPGIARIETFGDAAALAAQLSKSLTTPLPLRVVTDPKAPAPSQ